MKKQPMTKRNGWEILLNILFPGIGLILHGRWGIGISLLVANGLSLYLLWFVIMPVSLGILLYDRRKNGSNPLLPNPKKKNKPTP